jgi:HD superfamily phosphodiesterase
MDYVSATRAALLHDYFTKNDFDEESTSRKELVNHPSIACINALKEFKLNELEINAIESHMFPLSKTLPKYKESWLLTLVDKSAVESSQSNNFTNSGAVNNTENSNCVSAKELDNALIPLFQKRKQKA